MNFCDIKNIKIFLVILAIGSIFIAHKINSWMDHEEDLILDDHWWGPGEPGVDDTKIRPFTINVSEEVLRDLQQRLNNTRPLTPPLEGTNHNYGLNSYLIQEILEFWKTKYNWKNYENSLNQYNHYKTQIQGLDIHFMHIKPKATEGLKVLPILMLHGWPGTIREYHELIPLLINPRDGKNFIFELIIPSMPGFIFSQGSSKPGMGTVEMAVVFKNLMERIGYKKYYLQGSDWGGVVAANMAAMYSDRVLGLYSSFCLLMTLSALAKTMFACIFPTILIEDGDVERLCPISNQLFKGVVETGYFHLQATKPDSVAVALNESPIGMATYILDKVIIGTNPAYRDRADGGLKLKFTYEALLDNLMLHWITNSITTSSRIYAESSHWKQSSIIPKRFPIKVPTACAKFRHEILYQPDWILKEWYTNMIQSTSINVGGHFAVMEEPALLADDLWSAVEKIEAINNE